MQLLKNDDNLKFQDLSSCITLVVFSTNYFLRSVRHLHNIFSIYLAEFCSYFLKSVSYYYSNFGAIVDVSAPGGDVTVNNGADGVASTLNTGTTVPDAETYVYYQGKFYSNAAIISLIETKRDFKLFRTQHFIPTDKELITTDVDTSERLVKEINGEPAALAYAKVNNLDVNQLSATEFSMYPVMLNLGEQWYVRSIAKMNSDLSLNFYCAIDEGLPLSVGKGVHIVDSLAATTEEFIEEFEQIDFTLGCDCILRRLEVLEKDKVADVEPLFSSIRFIGFNSYGEQFNGVHFNQTLTGIVVGKKTAGKKKNAW